MHGLRKIGLGSSARVWLLIRPNRSANPMQISQPDLISEFVDKQVRDGGFRDASAYVRESVLRDQKQCAEAQLEALLIKGLLEAMESGEPLPWNEEYRQSLRTELREWRKSKA